MRKTICAQKPLRHTRIYTRELYNEHHKVRDYNIYTILFVMATKKSIKEAVMNVAKETVEVAKGTVEFIAEHLGFKQRYKMLLIGETGSGKTSFLNFLCNSALIQALGYVEGSEQFHRFNDIKLENVEAKKMESKTYGVKLYKVELCELKIGVIDSPGFGDSRGLSEDKRNAKKIVSALTSEEYVNCICLVINGRMARMSATLRYVMTEVTAILPRIVLNNVIVVFTNVGDPLDLNFDPGSLKDFFGQDIKEENIFCLENPYCRLEKAKEKQATLSRKRIAASLQKSFDEAGFMLKDMCEVIKKFAPVHTCHFEELYQKKQEIERRTLRLLTEYDNQKSLEKAIKRAEESVKVASNSKELNANYRSTQTVTRWNQVPTKRHNTLCGAAHCYSNCHVPCHLPKSFDKEVFRKCRSMDGGDTCTECNHSYRLHHHDEVVHVKEETVEEMIDEETRKRFEDAKSMEERERIISAGLREKTNGRKEKTFCCTT